VWAEREQGTGSPAAAARMRDSIWKWSSRAARIATEEIRGRLEREWDSSRSVRVDSRDGSPPLIELLDQQARSRRDELVAERSLVWFGEQISTRWSPHGAGSATVEWVSRGRPGPSKVPVSRAFGAVGKGTSFLPSSTAEPSDVVKARTGNRCRCRTVSFEHDKPSPLEHQIRTASASEAPSADS
jgi:hypothetical protein